MRTTLAFSIALAAAATLTLGGSALAADKYSATIVENSSNATDFHFLQGGSKVQIKPSTKAGDGGIIAQLNLKFVDCPAPGPGNGGTGECGSNGSCCDATIDPTCAGQVP